MGFQALKNAGKEATNVAVAVGEEVVEQTGTNVIKNADKIKKVAVSTREMIKNYACNTGKNLIVKEGIRYGCDKLSKFGFE
mmetsp:Transcript_13495/g.11554  ORF Transcript_13495/g.11554 Transcript_13495/m.11554 type:complete len:81 (+) Transcript_13495:110-352(+)